MSIPSEPPSRRIKRVERTFTTTTDENLSIIGLLMTAHRLIVSEIEAEEKKPATKRATEADIAKMKKRAALLARVTRQISSV